MISTLHQGASIVKSKIVPATLKSLRERRKMSQTQLADATRGRNTVSVPTIKRIETASEVYDANPRVAQGLALALGVSVEDLAKVSTNTKDRVRELRELGLRSVKATIDAETALAFDMVQHLYGISTRSQIEMAPLFAAILAEASLAWRRKRVAQIETAAAELMSQGGGHYSFTFAAARVEEGAHQEHVSIEKRDFFGRHASDDAYELGYDPAKNNPFTDFLAHLIKDVEAHHIGLLVTGLGWKTDEGLPEYRIGSEFLANLTGSDPDAEHALLHGHVRIKDIPADLMGQEREGQRVAWLIARIPEEERRRIEEQRAELAALFPDLQL